MKKIQAESQIRLSNVQIESLNRKIQHTNLVEQEVASLPADTKIYKAVGRMWVLQVYSVSFNVCKIVMID